MVSESLFNLYVQHVAKFAPEDLFGRPREDFEDDLAKMPAGEHAELVYGTCEAVQPGVYKTYQDGAVKYLRVAEDSDEPEITIVYPHKVDIVVYKETPPEKRNEK